MAGKWFFTIALVMLSAPTVGAIGQAGEFGAVHAPDWAGGLSTQAPLLANHEGTVGQAQSAVGAAVGIPEQIRERLMAQVGGQVGDEEQPGPGPVQAAVGIPEQIRERLMAQVGGQVGDEEQPGPGPVQAAVGIPEQIRERLMAHVGGQVGDEEQPGPGPVHAVVGLDLAGIMAAHANTVGNRPEVVGGLENAATHISERAREALRLTPIQWIADHLAAAPVPPSETGA